MLGFTPTLGQSRVVTMRIFITSNTKQKEVVKNHAMRALVHITKHFGRGGEMGVAGQISEGTCILRCMFIM
jgi:hypothetical protein